MKTKELIFSLIFIHFILFSGLSMAGSIKAFDVVINEIMADPTPVVGLPAYEYIEIYNRTSQSIDLNGWYITIGTRTKQLSNVSIDPQSYLLISDTASAKYFSAYGKVYALTSLSINNIGTNIILTNSQKQVISVVSFTDSWYQNEYKKEGGWSLEQIDPFNPCAGQDNWKASMDKSGGTPGRKNSVYALNPDSTIPDIDRVSVIDSSTIKLFFTEALDSTSLLNISNYYIDNSIGKSC